VAYFLCTYGEKFIGKTFFTMHFGILRFGFLNCYKVAILTIFEKFKMDKKVDA
jgi:hypothetical protein